jgi:Bacterial Ig domain
VQITKWWGVVRGLIVAAIMAGVASCGGGGGGGGGAGGNPVLGTSSFSTNENVALSGTLTATDPGGQAVTFSMGTGPKSGTLSGLPSAGKFVYTPTAGFSGSDSFTVTATDTAGNATTGTISITVVRVPPVLGATAFSTNENLPLNGTLTATDPSKQTVTFAQGTAPQNGTLSGFSAAGSFVYTPKPGYTGSDSFTVTATDTGGSATTGTITVTVVKDPGPTVNNTIVSATGATQAATLASINVLANASSSLKESLTVKITPNTTLVGTATVNSDQSVSITGLPANFKGLTRFQYTITDQSGLSGSGTAAVFVGSVPFSTAFVADSASAGAGSYEVYLTDFAASPVKESTATSGTLRLQGFAISDNGATIVYRTQDTTNAAQTSLSFVRTASSTPPAGITLPSGAVPIADASGKDQFVISPDGNWVAMIAGQASNNSLYVMNVTNPTVVTAVTPTIAGTPAVYATQPTFTSDSKNIYFLATSVAGGASKSLFFTPLSSTGPSAPTLASALSDPASSDEIYSYSVALNQSAIIEQANRAGRVGIFFVTPPNWTVEQQINQAPATGDKITTSTVGLAPGLGGSWTGTQVAYDVGDSSVADSVGGYVANVSATPNPQLLAPFDQVVGFSPPVGNAAATYLLYTDGAGLFDINAAGGSPGTQVGKGNQGWYDSTGNIVLLQNPGSAGAVTLSYNVRPFNAAQTITPTGTVAYGVDVSGFGQGVLLLAEAQSSAAAPTTANLQLVDVLALTGTSAAPQPFYLSSLTSTPSLASPMQLTSYVSKIVSQ